MRQEEELLEEPDTHGVNGCHEQDLVDVVNIIDVDLTVNAKREFGSVWGWESVVVREARPPRQNLP